MAMGRCYNCGIDLKGVPNNKEHIPMQCIGDGFTKKKTSGWIKVSACVECNDDYSKIDEEYARYIAIKTDGAINDKILKKSVDFFTRNPDRVKADENGLALQFSENTIDNLIVKHFKGLYMRTWHKPFPEDDFNIVVFKSETSLPEEQYLEIKQHVASIYKTFIRTIPEWSVSGHEEMFRYKIVRKGVIDGEFVDAVDADEMKECMCAMHSYLGEDSIDLVYASRKKIPSDNVSTKEE